MIIFFLLGCRVVKQNSITPLSINQGKLREIFNSDDLTFVYFWSAENKNIKRELCKFQSLLKIYGKKPGTSFLLLLVGKDPLGVQHLGNIKSSKFMAYHCSEDIVFNQNITCLPSLIVVKNGKVMLVYKGYLNTRILSEILNNLRSHGLS